MLLVARLPVRKTFFSQAFLVGAISLCNCAKEAPEIPVTPETRSDQHAEQDNGALGQTKATTQIQYQPSCDSTNVGERNYPILSDPEIILVSSKVYRCGDAQKNLWPLRPGNIWQYDLALHAGSDVGSSTGQVRFVVSRPETEMNSSVSPVMQIDIEQRSTIPEDQSVRWLVKEDWRGIFLVARQNFYDAEVVRLEPPSLIIPRSPHDAQECGIGQPQITKEAEIGIGDLTFLEVMRYSYVNPGEESWLNASSFVLCPGLGIVYIGVEEIIHPKDGTLPTIALGPLLLSHTVLLDESNQVALEIIGGDR